MKVIDYFYKKTKYALQKKIMLKRSHESNAYERELPWREMEELYKVPNIHIGKHTYGLTAHSIMRPTEQASVKIGNFCSFAPGVKILAHVNHPTSIASTYPLKTLFINSRSDQFDKDWTNHDATSKGAISIGHDVWVGLNAIILSGVSIGNGAVIGAGSIVTKDIPSYAIAVGNPAHVIKYRFTVEVIKELEILEWWNLPDKEIESLLPYFYGNINDFLLKLKSRK